MKIFTVEPGYIYREFTHDFPAGFEKFSKYAGIAIPIICLNPQWSIPFALGLGAARAAGSCYELYKSPTCAHLLAAQMAVISLVGTVFAHPFGMLISTAHDMIIELSICYNTASRDHLEATLFSLGKVVNNSLYFALFFHAGPQLYICSLIVQGALQLFRAKMEMNETEYLVAAGNIVLGLIRFNQARGEMVAYRESSRVATPPQKSAIKIEAPSKGELHTIVAIGNNTMGWSTNVVEADLAPHDITLIFTDYWDQDSLFGGTPLRVGSRVFAYPATLEELALAREENRGKFTTPNYWIEALNGQRWRVKRSGYKP